MGFGAPRGLGSGSNSSRMSGAESRFSSIVGGVDYSQGPESVSLRSQVCKVIAKKLKVQRRVYDTQLKNVKVLVMQEALDFIK